jgi:hypothetical protein
MGSRGKPGVIARDQTMAAMAEVREVSMAASREQILAEIRRTAEENGGRPLGGKQFTRSTGLSEYAVHQFWRRYSEAVTEAGLAPNEFNTARASETELLDMLAVEVRRLGRLPTSAELIMRHRADAAFPNERVFGNRVGPQRARHDKLLTHCADRSDLADVLAILGTTPRQERQGESTTRAHTPGRVGFVYLVRVPRTRRYKIGMTYDMKERLADLQRNSPDPPDLVHVIQTDDPSAIESYWHRRFDAQRVRKEWFDLSAADVRAFTLLGPAKRR